MFKKTCFNCGNKVDKIYEGKCEECFKIDSPPIKEIKPLNIRYCNMCKKLLYSNQYYTTKELEKRFPDIIKKNLVLNDHYKLNNIEIIELSLEVPKVTFDVEVDCDLIDN